jgi:uncharacterized protein (DUF1015 family)
MKNIISKPKVLLPKDDIDMMKWSVIACDQYTSPNENYWQKVEELVGNAPSTLKMIFPEYYLKDTDLIDARITNIQKYMKEYIENGILVEKLEEDRFIYTRRTLPNGKVRKGLMVLLDLEQYSYKKDEKLPIRPTEGIVEERLPIRMKIREGAPIEFPHILMLIDDPEMSVIEPLEKTIPAHKKLYDFELMIGGGHVEGYAVTSEEEENRIFKAINKLNDEDMFKQKYGLETGENPIVIAVGDGNHSLASAKAVWEKTKEKLIEEGESWEDNPARYAMAELINIHDEALEFESIHRVLFNVDNIEDFLSEMKNFYQNLGSACDIAESEEPMTEPTEGFDFTSEPPSHLFKISYHNGEKLKFLSVIINPGVHSITVGSLQMFLDQYVKDHPESEIDYIHGIGGVLRDSSKKGNIGFFLPSMKKEDLFRTVAKEGVTPRKTFSMGEADTKAYYIMGRKII